VQFGDPCIDGKRRKRPREEKTKIKNEEEEGAVVGFIFSL
jgi:hypothetical protein